MARSLVLALACAGFAAAASAQTPAAPEPAPAAQELCGVLEARGETLSFTPIEGFSLLTATPPLTPPAGEADALVCIRAGVVLGPNDHRVISDLHMPLFIRTADRLAVLEMTDAGLRLRFLQGEPTQEEAQALSVAIDRAHAEMRGGR